MSDILLGLATLEEVFLNIARRAELETATVEGTIVTLELESGLSLEIPVGARFVGIPDTENAENPSVLATRRVGVNVHIGTLIGDACTTECSRDTTTITTCIRTYRDTNSWYRD
ncbi:unnamed protein product [Cochlearia groenlandica]